MKYPTLIIACMTTLVACGGGGGGSSSGSGSGSGSGSINPPPAQSDYAAGIFSSANVYKDRCEVPRAGTADLSGSTEDENNWLRSWSHDLYLWYDEIIDEDPAAYTTLEYFDLMKTFELSQTGADKDRFHFTYDTEAWERLSQSGIAVGYGAVLELVTSSVPREAFFVYVTPGSPADSAGILRGTRILEVDGVDLINSTNVDVLNAGLFPANPGETHEFRIADYNGTNERLITMTAIDAVEDPVPITNTFSTPQGVVGYFLFTSFISPAEESLVDAVNDFNAAGVTELVLDLRYNNGGFLDIANELAFMVAGPGAQGQVFEEIQFNDKHPNVNPVTGQSLSPTNFHSTTQGFSLTSGLALPTLSLSRVYILVGPSTASASESVINGLQGIDFQVILVGNPTTGKPYGFYPTDNCGTTYFSIQFKGINAKGFGDFADGFVPHENPVEAYEVQGCDVQDDLETELGDPSEARLATALGLIGGLDCSAASPIVMSPSAEQVHIEPEPIPDAASGTGTGTGRRIPDERLVPRMDLPGKILRSH